jgi:flavin reductase (DIM6/NTAB) family NADH-FMN oxidoreductase RutF
MPASMGCRMADKTLMPGAILTKDADGTSQSGDAPVADVQALKQAFGCFTTGVTIVTIMARDGTPRGFTANSFTSLSLHPPMCLICIGDQVRSFEEFAGADRFAVSVLAAEQEPVARLFASHDDARFDKVDWHPAEGGAPIIAGALSWFDCAVAEQVPVADHRILIGQIEASGARDGDGLGYFRSGYRAISSQC